MRRLPRRARRQTHLRVYAGAAISGWPGPGIQPGNRPIISICASGWTAPGRSSAPLDFVRPEDVAGSNSLRRFRGRGGRGSGGVLKVGFTDLALVQIGGTEPEQARFFAAAPELITALKETAG